MTSGELVVAEGVLSMRKTTVQNGGFQTVSTAIAMCHKNDGNASSRAQKSSTIIQKYKVVQLFPKFIASVPTPLLKR